MEGLVGNTGEYLFKLLETFGFYIGGLAFFIWRSEGRIDKLEKKIEQKDAILVESLIALNRESTSAIMNNTAALDRNTAVMQHVLEQRNKQ